MAELAPDYNMHAPIQEHYPFAHAAVRKGNSAPLPLDDSAL
jgi:hypothetical protein